MMFLRFMFCLGIGLIGLSMVLMTMLETIFADWDVAAEMRHAMKRRRVWVRHMLDYRHDEHQHEPGRLNAYGRPARPAPPPELAHQPVHEAAHPAAAEESRELVAA